MLMSQLEQADRIVVADGGSTDGTINIAVKGAVLAMGAEGRGQQLALGARHSGDASWFLFIHADNELPENWRESVARHISRHPKSIGYFRYRAKAKGLWPRIMDFWVGMRCQWWGLPYGDQGLLMSKSIYEELGGYPEQSLFEDVALITRIKTRLGRTTLRSLKGHMRLMCLNMLTKAFGPRGLKT